MRTRLKEVIVIKRGPGKGSTGIENLLFYLNHPVKELGWKNTDRTHQGGD